MNAPFLIAAAAAALHDRQLAIIPRRAEHSDLIFSYLRCCSPSGDGYDLWFDVSTDRTDVTNSPIAQFESP